MDYFDQTIDSPATDVLSKSNDGDISEFTSSPVRHFAQNKHQVSNFDRFIPFRPNLDVDSAHYSILLSEKSNVNGSRNPPASADGDFSEYQKHLDLAFGVQSDKRILPLTPQCKTRTKEAVWDSPWQGTIDCSSPLPNQVVRCKTITSPDKMLDLPDLPNDFYMNVLDWSIQNYIAVAINQSTYIWNPESGECNRTHVNLSIGSFVSSLAWDQISGKYLLLGSSTGDLMTWDTEALKWVRSISSTEDRHMVSVVWRGQTYISASRSGNIFLHDHRTSDKSIRFIGHHPDACNLKLSKNSHFLASGGDDGHVVIWDLVAGGQYQKIKAHKASSKALAWCQRRPGIIASGGGSNDGYIRLWDIHTGERKLERFTNSQICSLLWSNEKGDIISSHGTQDCSNNDVVIWKTRGLDTIEPCAKLVNHKARPLHIALSPDETTLVSAAADETMCVWKNLPSGKKKRQVPPMSPLLLLSSIR